jgi:hypothetical protein
MDSSSSWFDLRVILIIPIKQFAPWFAAVILVTWAGYPGVVCVTPLAWLLALRVGIECAMYSTSDSPSRRILEAALAGGWFGFLQGMLFLVIVPRMGEIKASEQSSATLISIIMVGMGMLVGAGLSAFTAQRIERRHEGM